MTQPKGTRLWRIHYCRAHRRASKKADLGVGKLFLAPIGKLETQKMFKHYCNACEKEFVNPPKIHVEEKDGW